MALGSQNKAVRKTFQKEIVHKSDWKAQVTNVAAATTMINTIRANVADDPNGKYLLAAYCSRQINTLEDYIKNSGRGVTLKEYLFKRGR
jgi:hypothetical protein